MVKLAPLTAPCAVGAYVMAQTSFLPESMATLRQDGSTVKPAEPTIALMIAAVLYFDGLVMTSFLTLLADPATA